MDHEQGRFTLVFLCAAEDEARARQDKAPMVELTYNWPDSQGKAEQYTGGRNFGHLAWRVDDIYAICQRFRDAGVTINRPPRDGHMAFVRSPEGISIERAAAGRAATFQPRQASALESTVVFRGPHETHPQAIP